MFILSVLRDNVRVSPADFHKPRSVAITENLHFKYANKVVHNIGLCIRVYDILHADDPVVHACQDGSYKTKVTFRMIVFRPFIDEVLVGKISGSTPYGIKVSMEFFDDIIIPPHRMQPNTIYDASEGVWVWHYEGNELYLDKDQQIRFRVNQLQFNEAGPEHSRELLQRVQAWSGAPAALNSTVGAASLGAVVDGAAEASNEEKIAPFTIDGDILGDGLGCLSWWQ
ncbi:RNA polymerase III subunit Rpc25-domain-containing protein [Cladochytrium replicatum]|nr:RNA polymerase III subunit Rpc25-domain-containing protein [Cladochytrium replicatum]